MQADYLDHMGTDLTVVNAARVSFNAESTELSDRDKGLIQFLARGCMKEDWNMAINELFGLTTDEEDYATAERILKWAKNMPTHWTPFAHCMVSIRETVPIFVARQRFKHMVGFTYNEVSRRYVDDTPEFHFPTEWRARPEGGIKQGSGGTHSFSHSWDASYRQYIREVEGMYTQMVADGVAPEQARMILPQSMLTSYWVTGSLYAWANAYIQRSDSHAQVEIQQLASQWNGIIEPLFPVSWAALTQ